MPEPTPLTWPQRRLLQKLVTRKKAETKAAEEYEQAVRDAVRGGVPIQQIAAAVGVRNRKFVYRIMRAALDEVTDGG